MRVCHQDLNLMVRFRFSLISIQLLSPLTELLFDREPLNSRQVVDFPGLASLHWDQATVSILHLLPKVFFFFNVFSVV